MGVLPVLDWHFGIGGRKLVGIVLCSAREISGRQLSHHVSSCSGSASVSGCLHRRCNCWSGVYRLARKNGGCFHGVRSTDWVYHDCIGVDIGNSLGKTHLGRLVGLGRSNDLGSSPVLSLLWPDCSATSNFTTRTSGVCRKRVGNRGCD